MDPSSGTATSPRFVRGSIGCHCRAFDENTTATVFIDPDNWFTDQGPRPEFYDLEAALLDAAN